MTATPVIQRFSDLDTERRVIGSALMDPEAIVKVGHLKPDDFYGMAHRNIWEAILDLGKSSDWSTVKGWLERRDLLKGVEELTGPVDSYLMHAGDIIPTALNIERYAADMIELARRRELHAALDEALNANYKGKPISAIGNRISSTLANMEPAGKDETLADVIAAYSAEREAERDGTKTMGIPSGIGDLDRWTNGWRPGNLVVVTGPSGGGKTTMMVGFAMEAAKRKHKALFLSLEMSATEIVRKATAYISGVPTGHDAVPAMTPQRWEDEYDGLNTLAGYPFLVKDTPGITIGGVAEAIRKESAKGHVDLVVVDYLGAMTPEGGGNRNESRANQIGNITRTLKALAGQMKCAIILGAQLNREAGMSEEPQLRHLKDSSNVEQDANMVLMLHDQADKLRPTARTLFLRKNRNGPTGAVPLTARLDISRIKGTEQESHR